MNYYIQGSSARAKEIKAAFEAKGCTLYRLISQCDSEDLIYYSLNGRVRCIKKDNLYLFEAHPGYTKLELPIEPKFKVGDSLQSGSEFTKILSINLEEERYYCDNRIISFENQDLWHLVPKPHYDISNFYAGMPVLVRDNDKEWRYVPFSHITNSSWKFNAVGTIWEQCIPFNDDTKHLLGTTDPCDEQYINW